MSDQYVKLEEERRHRQRLERDKKRKKKKDKDKKGKPRRHGSLHTESDDDLAPAQQVDIVTEEMPEVSLLGLPVLPLLLLLWPGEACSQHSLCTRLQSRVSSCQPETLVHPDLTVCPR